MTRRGEYLIVLYYGNVNNQHQNQNLRNDVKQQRRSNELPGIKMDNREAILDS